VWEDELQNVFQMSYGTGTPSNSQDVDGIVALIFLISIFLLIFLNCLDLSLVLNLQVLVHQAI